MLRTAFVAAVAGSAAAFAPAGPMALRMSADVSRRDVSLAGAAGVAFGAVAPANAQIIAGTKKPTPKKVGADRMPAKNFAPVITIFDHRGCARAPREYKGEKSGDNNDEMCVKVAQTQLKVDSAAAKELASSVRAVSRILNLLCACSDYTAVFPSWSGSGQLCHLQGTMKLVVRSGKTGVRKTDVCLGGVCSESAGGWDPWAVGAHGRAVPGIKNGPGEAGAFMGVE